MKSVLKNKIKQDLQGLGNKYEVVVHGSQVLERTRPNSDIDIAMPTATATLNAAGDITGELAQTVVAAGSGAVAATSAFEFVKGLK